MYDKYVSLALKFLSNYVTHLHFANKHEPANKNKGKLTV